jgi:hypothetical protein
VVFYQPSGILGVFSFLQRCHPAGVFFGNWITCLASGKIDHWILVAEPAETWIYFKFLIFQLQYFNLLAGIR